MPIELIELSGFRSHLHTALDLCGVTAATIVGPNGGGKSSLQEGFRWIWFGETDSRGGRGHLKVRVPLCKGVSIVRTLSGQRYRATRTQKTSGELGTTLLLETEHGAGGWVPVPGKKIADTERKIREDIFGMDYHTLIASAISPQAKSNYFTSPPEIRIDGKAYEGRQARIQIAAQSEGLSIWEERQKGIKRLAMTVDQQATILETQVGQAAASLQDLTGLAEREIGALQSIEAARASIATTTAQLEQATRELATLEAQIPAAEQELAGYADIRLQIENRSRSLHSKSERADDARGLIARRTEIETASKRVAELDTLLAQQREQLTGLEAEGKGAKAALGTAEVAVQAANVAHAKASTALDQARKAVADRPSLEAKVARLGKIKSEREMVSELKMGLENERNECAGELSRIMSANLAAQTQAGEIEAEARTNSGQQLAVGKELDADRTRAGLIASVPCNPQPDLVATCPLLANARSAAEGIPSLMERHAALCAWVRPASPPQQDTAPLRAEIAKIEAAIAGDRKTRATLDAEIATLQPAVAELASLDTISATLPGLEADEAAARVARDEAVLSAAKLKGTLDAVKVRWLGLQAQVKDGETTRAGLSASAALANDLAQADRDLPGLEGEIAEHEAVIEGLRLRLQDESKTADWLDEARRTISALTNAMEEERAEIAQHQAAERSAVQTAAECRAEIGRLEALKLQTAAAREEAAALRRTHTLRAALVQACKQIPIMILETAAIPEIAEDANRILMQASANGMTTRMSTYREVASRADLPDGLDIWIQDDEGERSYEDYNGGAKWTIDFAYRLAQTKRQCRKSRGGLGVLWLDEGFGVKDRASLEAIIALLRELRADYAQVLITSHVEAMQEMFETQISVEGGPRCSMVRVSGGPVRSVVEVVTA